MMDFKEKAKKIDDISVTRQEMILNITVALREAHSLGVKQGREQQRERDIQIVENVIERVCGDKNSVVTRKIKEEILSAKGE